MNVKQGRDRGVYYCDIIKAGHLTSSPRQQDDDLAHLGLGAAATPDGGGEGAGATRPLMAQGLAHMDHVWRSKSLLVNRLNNTASRHG